MRYLPDIVVSSHDLDRLEDILQDMPAARRAACEDLRRELLRATVVTPSAMPSSVVTMNSIVRFAISDSDEIHQARLCFPQDMDGSADRISVLSPVGTALLGLAQGETITWTGPSGKAIVLQVKEVVFQPERDLQRSA
jgi:regulator of nucleoside diphosphate kinase